MDQAIEKATEGTAVVPATTGDAPRSLMLAEGGVKTGKQFAGLMSALMSDVIAGRITPSVGNAACNAGGKLLKVVEMQMRYGTKGSGADEKTLLLSD